MKMWKRGVLLCLLAMLLLLPVAAYSPAVHGVTVNVLLHQDGSADITETWDVTVASGTEWYLVQSNLGDMTISNFAVSENGKPFEQEGEWDVDRSIEEKAGKCGVVTKSDGAELCWGVGSYGDHVFTASYTMTGLVKKFTDYNGFYHRFINDELSAAPEKIDVWIEKEGAALTTEDTAIWAFGYDGEIWVQDGKIHASSNNPLQSSSYVNILARFSPELFTPALQKEESFDDLKNQAMEGSDYTPDGSGNSSDDNWEWENQEGIKAAPIWIRGLVGITGFLFNPIVIIAIVVFVFSKAKSSGNRQGGAVIGAEKINEKEVEWCRDLPQEGDLPATYALLRMAGRPPEDGGLVGAYLLRFMQKGCVTVEERETKGFLGIGSSTETSIVLKHSPNGTAAENRFYQCLESAAGSDGILQEKEFYRWSRAHYSTVFEGQNDLYRAGADQLRGEGALEIREQPVFFGLFHVKKEALTEKGLAMARQALGFKKYLEEFSLINERQPAEVALWDDYLVMATLFGIADRVSETFKELYPRYFENPAAGYNGTDGDWMRMMLMVNHMSHAMSRGANEGRTAAQQAMRSSGGGGGASFHGGGGFSGGGHGGGSR